MVFLHPPMPLITPPSFEFSDWANRALCTPGSIIHNPNPFVFFPCWGWFWFYFRHLYLTLLTPLVCSMYPIYHSLAPPYLCLLIFGLVMVFTSCTSISDNPAPPPRFFCLLGFCCIFISSRTSTITNPAPCTHFLLLFWICFIFY